jgi:hypothetical protein
VLLFTPRSVLLKFLSSHVIHFFLMGGGIALVLGMLTPTMRPERTRISILKYLGGLVGIGLALAWVMYLLPRNPVRF